MQNCNWPARFHEIYDRAVSAYRAGRTSPAALFPAADVKFLATIGCSAQELFDFVEDFVRRGAPDYDTALLITAERRDYFLTGQGGQPSGKKVDMDALPSKQAVAGGLPWLPRIIVKARAKLRGEMPPDLMYCCGGDLAFLEKAEIHPADFLRFVRAAGDDDQKIIEWVRRGGRAGVPK